MINYPYNAIDVVCRTKGYFYHVHFCYSPDYQICSDLIITEREKMMAENEDFLSLSNIPLHGISLHIDGRENDNVDTPYGIQVSFRTICPLPDECKIWSLVDSGERYTSTLSLLKDNETVQLQVDCEGKGCFELVGDTLSVDWQANGTGAAHYFQTLITSLYLEQKHHLCLHANTLVKDEKAYLFIAPSRTGKSTLTSYMSQHEFDLTTDDMAAIYDKNGEYFVYPSWPKVRLWPDSAKFITETIQLKHSDKKKVHSRFDKEEFLTQLQKNHTPTPIKGIIFLNRKEDVTTETSFSSFQASKALITLLQNSILGDAYSSLELNTSRVKNLASLLEKVPAFELVYPTGMEFLNSVCEKLSSEIHKRL